MFGPLLLVRVRRKDALAGEAAGSRHGTRTRVNAGRDSVLYAVGCCSKRETVSTVARSSSSSVVLTEHPLAPPDSCHSTYCFLALSRMCSTGISEIREAYL